MPPSPYFPAKQRLVTEAFDVLCDLPDGVAEVAQAHESSRSTGRESRVRRAE
jgi:hypothetical protein